jgi:hypothetical protein
MGELVTIWVEHNDGIYNSYSDKHNHYICGSIKEVHINADTAKDLCEITTAYNEAQDLLWQIYNS